MNTLLGLMDKYYRVTRMSLSVTKTFVLSTRRAGRSWNIGKSGNTLEDSMMAKYLGVNIQLRGKCTVRREEDVISSAMRFTHSIMSLTRANLTGLGLHGFCVSHLEYPPFFMLWKLWSYAKRLWWPLRSFRPMVDGDWSDAVQVQDLAQGGSVLLENCEQETGSNPERVR